MFYSGNDNYMQDLYYGNQMIGPNTYNPNSMNNFDNNMQNPMYMNNGMYMNQVPNQNRFAQNQNINNMYPSSYRILMPVVSRVVSNSNYQFLNEDVLNNMVDTVYNITEGQFNFENDNEQVTQERSSNTQINSASVSQTHPNNISTTNTTTRVNNDSTQTTTRNNSSTNNSNDDLLRDLIKILIIREIIARRQFQNNMNMYNMNNGMNQFCNM